MDFFLIIVIIIIIFAVLYIFYRNKQYYDLLYSLENFNNSTQSSLSTYFQNTVDYDSYQSNANMFNGINLINNGANATSSSPWDGIWQSSGTSNPINAQIIQYNKTLLISLTNSSVNQLYQTNPNINFNNITSSTFSNIQCYPNLFIGIADLNNPQTEFTLVSVICNNYSNSSLNLTTSPTSNGMPPLFGMLVNNNNTYTINLSTTTGGIITLSLMFPFTYYNNYAKTFSPNTNTLPIINNNNIVLEEVFCEGGTVPCFDNTLGIASTAYLQTYNACGTTNGTSNLCQGTPACIYYTPPPGSTNSSLPPQCEQNFTINDYMNYGAMSLQAQYVGNSLLMCDYLQYFPNPCNSCIIAYVSSVGNVYTLNYQFFGSLPGESNLTTQLDIMDQYLNTTGPSEAAIVAFYRNIINYSTNASQSNILNALTFTNCINSNGLSSLSTSSINNCIVKSKGYIAANYNGPLGNPLLSPCVWQINITPTKNILTSCPVTLSTSQLYNTPIKYANFNPDGTANLSLYPGGTNQLLTLDKATIVNENTDSTSTYVAITTNLKTNSGLYLTPYTDYSGFNNSTIVGLANEPSPNGKWLIIGFTLNNINSLSNIISGLNFNLYSSS
jgi:hypothetical protein